VNLIDKIESLKAEALELPEGESRVVICSPSREDILSVRIDEPGDGQVAMHSLGSLYASKKEHPLAVFAANQVWVAQYDHEHIRPQVMPRDHPNRKSAIFICGSTPDRRCATAVHLDGAWEVYSNEDAHAPILDVFWDGLENKIDRNLIGSMKLRWETPCPWKNDETNPQAWADLSHAPTPDLIKFAKFIEPTWLRLSRREKKRVIADIRQYAALKAKELAERN
jgi:hypothetical protein